jgi:hypothetical protein
LSGLPAWLRPFHRRGARALLVFSLLLSIVIVVPFIIASHFSPPPYLVIDLLAETMRYRVQRPDLSGVPLIRAQWDQGPELCPNLGASNVYDGVVVPSVDTLVRYLWQPKQVAIQILRSAQMTPDAPIAELTSSGGNNCLIVADVASFRIIAENLRPLPILGPAEVGAEMSAAQAPTPAAPAIYNLSYGGTLQIYGRTMSWPGTRGSLFKGEDTSYAIPAGSRLSSTQDLAGPAAYNAEPWYGMARFTKKDGFKIVATMENNDLVLYRPGGQAETFAISIIGRIINDPVLAWLFFCGAILAASISIATSFLGFWPDANEPLPEPKRPPKPKKKS